MKKIAVVFNGDLSINRQGQVNSAICRIKHLQQLERFEVDAYCIQDYSAGLLKLIRKEKNVEKHSVIVVDGITVRVIYKPCFFTSVLLETRFKIGSVISGITYWLLSKRFKDYDLISGHSIIGGRIGKVVSRRYGVPYCVTWHGSDIHTYPVSNKFLKRQVAGIITNASGNVFVSKALCNTGFKHFMHIPNPQVLYNAADSSFYKYPEEKRFELRRKWGVDGQKVVAFVGNLENVKNVLLLPGIFKQVTKKCVNVTFWVIGNGALRHPLEHKMTEEGLHCVFWGNQQPESMPDFMNCIDVLILPSKNESFGMVLVEAISCGANAVGSNRGGIPEVIGNDNCFELDGMFEDKTSDRIVYMLENKVEQSVNPKFNWSNTAEKEARLFSDIVNR